MSALILGEALVDMIITDKKRSMFSMEAYPGGSPANVAAALASLGVETSLITILGRDVFGKLITSTLESFGVIMEDTMETRRDTLLAIVHVDDVGIPTYSFRHDEGALDSAVNPLIDYPLLEHSLIHCGSLGLLFPEYRKIFLPALEKALQLGIRISLDPNIRVMPGIDEKEYREVLLSLMKKVHLFKASEEDLLYILGEEYLPRLKEIRGERPSFITMGAQGSLVLLGQWEEAIEPEKIKVVDTTGCGDAYMGGALSALIREEEWDPQRLKKAGEKGSFVAGEVAKCQGALEGLQGLGERLASPY